MNAFNRLLTSAAIGLAVSVSSFAAYAETPANMLVIANRIDDITTIDPGESFEFAGSDVIRNIYGRLVNFDPLNLDAGYQPDLAESWVVSEDGKSITFTMREGVTFHSGNPVRAEDAEFSLRRAVILNKTPSFILTQFGFTAENVEDTIKAEGNTLTITTDKKYATSFVLNCLTATIGGIVDKELVMANEVDGDMGNTWLKTNSAGSGAYKLVGWKPNESVTLESNPDFYLGAPAMERVIVRHVQESATQRLLLERGDIDVARNLNPEDIAGARQAEGVAIDDELRGRLMYISVNQKHPELSKPQVRQAIKYLVDYEGMQNSFLSGQWKIHQNFLPGTYLGSVNENPFSLNIEKAKELLAEAGAGEFEIEVGVREAQERIEITQSLQNTFAQAGITLNITVGTAKQILSRYRARELDMYMGAWGPDYPDPHTNAGTFAFNPDNTEEAGATGLLAWRNAWDTDGLTEKTAAAVIESDRDTRATMYQDIQAEFRDVAPFAILFQKVEQTGRAENVENLNLGGAITAVSYWPVTK
ncbi:putative D,D-dipeptide-binding periplasmic protein DdpA [Roseobacter fucihabitans]|uniref:D,D-dipeptide-binding periplasmic protein DdpA n=1 Tax=Roseobacter fucihabitans TaxID=1537242 RepID=A0ABZ2BY88_9RHOB|nr:ABC transporter substrate-binding protein [Roseobacter litoralis]MBC6966938.1 putative D,D-dipeptide-binding periplasmic protein DdpA precursor [Roseobacter litoralis]